MKGPRAQRTPAVTTRPSDRNGRGELKAAGHGSNYLPFLLGGALGPVKVGIQYTWHLVSSL